MQVTPYPPVELSGGKFTYVQSPNEPFSWIPVFIAHSGFMDFERGKLLEECRTQAKYEQMNIDKTVMQRQLFYLRTFFEQQIKEKDETIQNLTSENSRLVQRVNDESFKLKERWNTVRLGVSPRGSRLSDWAIEEDD